MSFFLYLVHSSNQDLNEICIIYKHSDMYMYLILDNFVILLLITNIKLESIIDWVDVGQFLTFCLKTLFNIVVERLKKKLNFDVCVV